MSIEAVAAFAAKEIGVQTARETAMQAAREIAQKMAAEAGRQGAGNELQTAMMERPSMQEGFRVGELPETKGEGQNEAAAVEELRGKIEMETAELAEVKSEYVDDLVARSEAPETIDKANVMNTSFEKKSPEQCQASRLEFNQAKSDLISQWEDKNGKEWPKYTEDVFLNGRKIRRAGDLYDCHHIQPLTYGGKNEVGNITPLHALEHFDRQGLHAFNSPCSRMESFLKLKEVA